VRAHRLLRRAQRLSPVGSIDDPETVIRLLPYFTIDELETLLKLVDVILPGAAEHVRRAPVSDPRVRSAHREFRRIVHGALRLEKQAQRRGRAA